MNKKINPFDAWGNGFWKRHLKCFKYIKYLLSVFIDFLEEQMKLPELSILIGAIYMIGLNTQLLGIYEAYAICSPIFPHYLSNIPAAFSLNSAFPKYSHLFYPLIFIGNLKSSPYLISLLCSIFSIYDFSLLVIDVSYI